MNLKAWNSVKEWLWSQSTILVRCLLNGTSLTVSVIKKNQHDLYKLPQNWNMLHRENKIFLLNKKCETRKGIASRESGKEGLWSCVPGTICGGWFNRQLSDKAGRYLRQTRSHLCIWGWRGIRHVSFASAWALLLALLNSYMVPMVLTSTFCSVNGSLALGVVCKEPQLFRVVFFGLDSLGVGGIFISQFKAPISCGRCIAGWGKFEF